MPEIPAGAIPEHVTIRRDDLLLTLLFVAGDEPVSVMPSEVLDRLFAAASASAVQAPVKECPQSAPGSTESAQTPTSRVSVPPEGAEGVSEPRKDDLRQRYADALSRSLTSPQRGMADHLDAMLAVRDDELADAVRRAERAEAKLAAAAELADKRAFPVARGDGDGTGTWRYAVDAAELDRIIEHDPAGDSEESASSPGQDQADELEQLRAVRRGVRLIAMHWAVADRRTDATAEDRTYAEAGRYLLRELGEYVGIPPEKLRGFLTPADAGQPHSCDNCEGIAPDTCINNTAGSPADVRQRFAEALAAKFTRPLHRYDRTTDTERVDKPNPVDRVDEGMAVHFTAGDGLPAFRTVTCAEAAGVCAAVRDDELAQARVRGDVAEVVAADARRRADQAEADLARFEDLLGTIWLHIGWTHVTRQLTTEQKELFADAIDNSRRRANRKNPAMGLVSVDRWWRDDAPADTSKEHPNA